MAPAKRKLRHDLRDPLYRRIVAELESAVLVADVFEHAMGDLLGDIFPGAVPVRGGSDAGWDGAVADGFEEPFPLICTTAESVERNFKKSLEALDKHPPSRRMAVLATSQRLTPVKRRALYSIAREKKFTLRQIIHQTDVAHRLYWSPRWRKELLGISGKPSALSAIPRTLRPVAGSGLIGRDDDLAWIRSQKRDFILHGQPGVGKTYLFHKLIQQGWEGLFLVATDEGEIADALLEQRPRFVVVDDAHVDPARLTRLLGLRSEDVGAEFSVAAVTWEGRLDEVRQALGDVPDIRVRRLELLTRQEILEVFQLAGVRAEDDILRELVSQAAHKPGLAMTIAGLWLQEDWQKVLDGTVLKRTLVGFFKDEGLADATQILACFALGGRRGMSIEGVGEFLRMARSALWRGLTDLAAGGVLAEKGDCLAVEPAALRAALLREVFFSGSPKDLPYQPLLEKAPSRSAAVEAIVEAALRGAQGGSTELRKHVFEAGNEAAWRGLAALEEHTEWVLEHFPGSVVTVGPEALARRPDLAVPRLLARAEEERRPAHQSPKALGILHDWALHLGSETTELLERRDLLARETTNFLRRGGQPAIGVEALRIAFSPEISTTCLDPGEGNTLKLSFGSPSLCLLEGLLPIWERAEPDLPSLDSATWPVWRSILWEWMHPGWVWKMRDVPTDLAKVAEEFTARILSSLASRTEGRPGLVTGLLDLAEPKGLSLSISRDPTFEVLFPPGIQEGEDPPHRVQALAELATRLSLRDPRDVARDLIAYEEEARLASRFFWPPGTLAMSRLLAVSATNPGKWLRAWRQENAPGHLLSPWLEEIARIRPPGWELTLARCLSTRAEPYVVETVLRQLDLPASLLEKTLACAPRNLRAIDNLTLLREIPIETLRELLRHPDPTVAMTAALGEWTGQGNAGVRRAIEEEWREAILRAGHEDEEEVAWDLHLQYELTNLLAQEPTLAFAWLERRLAEGDLPAGGSPRNLVLVAVSALGPAQRGELWSTLPESEHQTWFARALKSDREAVDGAGGLVIEKEAR